MIRRFLILAITIVFCYLIWWIGPLISIGTYFPLSGVLLRQIIIGLILFWAIWPIIALFFNRIFSYARMPIPNSKKKIVQLDPITARFFDALRTLRFISLSNKKNLYQKLKMRINQEYLNEKPWFLIIGPTGSGKTSLINQSGEDFISSEQYGFTNTSEMGPTKDCNWWFTERAVYIDTAGEWMLLHSENNEAGAARKKLFSLIRKYRHYPYIDGVMLCIDVSILLYSSLSEQKSLADTLRIRVAEVASYFLTDVPIYLFLNNIDKLPGGEVFLTILSDELLAQGLGIKLSSDQFNHNNFAVDETAYLALQERISNYVLESLHTVPNEDIRYQLLLFTETLGALKKPLFAFLEYVFPPSPIGYSGCLRQLWFGSTSPLIAKETLFDSETELIYEERKSGGMYYPALTQAILERGILQSVKYSYPQCNLTFVSRYIMATLFIGALALIITSRSFWESHFISSIIDSVEKNTQLIRKSVVIDNTVDNLLIAFRQLNNLNMQYSENRSPFLLPYFDQKLFSLTLNQAYRRNLYQVFWPAIKNYIEDELRQEIIKSNIDDYDTLKIYLMLFYPQHRDPETIVSWFMSRWSDFPTQIYSEDERNLFAYYLRELFEDSSLFIQKVELNHELVRKARINAMKISAPIRVVNLIKNKPLPNYIKDVSLASATGFNISPLLRRKSHRQVTDIAIPGFYTLASYRDLFVPQLQDTSSAIICEKNWVLADTLDNCNDIELWEESQKLSNEALDYYLIDYANQWEHFLADIRVRPINNLDDSVELARQFSMPTSSLNNLVQFAISQTTFIGDDFNEIFEDSTYPADQLSQLKQNTIDAITGRSTSAISPERSLDRRFTAIRRLGQPSTKYDSLNKVFYQVYNQLALISTYPQAGKILPQVREYSRLRDKAIHQPEPIRSIIIDLLSVGHKQKTIKNQLILNIYIYPISFDIRWNNFSSSYHFNSTVRGKIGIGDPNLLVNLNNLIKCRFDKYVNMPVSIIIIPLILSSSIRHAENINNIPFFNLNIATEHTYFTDILSEITHRASTKHMKCHTILLR